MIITDQLRQWARQLKRDTLALYLACRDPRTPWFAKVFAGAIVAYALSPIDLIPDFIPVLGYLDDLIIVPVGLMIAIRMIPTSVMEDCRERAQLLSDRPTSRMVVGVIFGIWIIATVFVVYATARLLQVI